MHTSLYIHTYIHTCSGRLLLQWHSLDNSDPQQLLRMLFCLWIRTPEARRYTNALFAQTKYFYYTQMGNVIPENTCQYVILVIFAVCLMLSVSSFDCLKRHGLRNAAATQFIVALIRNFVVLLFVLHVHGADLHPKK